MTDRPNSRRHQRYAVKIVAEVTVEGEALSVVTKDMSRGGICLVCPRRVAPGSQIGLSLSLVLGTNAFSESLELLGKVVWCTPIEGRFQVGAAFVQLDHEKSGYLDMFLRFLEQELQVPGASEPVPTLTPFDTGGED